MEYYELHEFERRCVKQKISSNVAYYAKKGIIRPVIYINSLPTYVQKLINDRPVIIGHCRLSAYWDCGEALLPMLDSVLSGKNTFLRDSTQKFTQIYPVDLESIDLYCWQIVPMLFRKFPSEMLFLQSNYLIEEVFRFIIENSPSIVKEMIYVKQIDAEKILATNSSSKRSVAACANGTKSGIVRSEEAKDKWIKIKSPILQIAIKEYKGQSANKIAVIAAKRKIIPETEISNIGKKIRKDSDFRPYLKPRKP